MQLKPIFIQKEVRALVLPDSYLKFLATTFIKREKKHCYEKRSIVIRNVDQISIANLITQDFCISVSS